MFNLNACQVKRNLYKSALIVLRKCNLLTPYVGHLFKTVEIDENVKLM